MKKSTKTALVVITLGGLIGGGAWFALRKKKPAAKSGAPQVKDSTQTRVDDVAPDADDLIFTAEPARPRTVAVVRDEVDDVIDAVDDVVDDDEIDDVVDAGRGAVDDAIDVVDDVVDDDEIDDVVDAVDDAIDDVESGELPDLPDVVDAVDDVVDDDEIDDVVDAGRGAVDDAIDVVDDVVDDDEIDDVVDAVDDVIRSVPGFGTQPVVPRPVSPGLPQPVPVPPPPKKSKSLAQVMVDELLNAQRAPNWVRDHESVSDYQESVDLEPDGMLGPSTALRLAMDVGTIPVLRAWNKQPFPQKQVREYKAALLEIAAAKGGEHAKQLKLSADRELGQAYPPASGIPKASSGKAPVLT